MREILICHRILEILYLIVIKENGPKNDIKVGHVQLSIFYSRK